MAIADRCRFAGVPLTVLGYNHPKEWVRSTDTRSLPSFTLRSQARGSRMKLLREMYRNSHVALVGADMVDGCYSEKVSLWLIRLLELAAICGARSELIGCSLNASSRDTILKAFTDLPREVKIRTRDPVSQRRLEQSASRLAELTADVAFLLKANEEDPSASRSIHWIKQQRARGRAILGFNLSKSVVDLKLSGQPADYVRLVTSELRDVLAERGVSILMIPHDDRGEWSDCVLAAEVESRLLDEFPYRVSRVEFPVSAAGIKGIVGHLDAVFSGRMHLAIACFGRGTPVACIDYQDKFAGLFEHFGLNGLLLSCEETLPAGALSNLIRRLLTDRLRIKSQIEERLPMVLKLAEKNLAFLREPV